MSGLHSGVLPHEIRRHDVVGGHAMARLARTNGPSRPWMTSPTLPRPLDKFPATDTNGYNVEATAAAH